MTTDQQTGQQTDRQTSPADQPGPAATGPSPGSPPGRRGKGYFLPGSIALVVLLAIGLFVGAGDLQHPAPRTLVGSDIASQISLGIQAQQNSTHAPSVTCPAREPVRPGYRFVCALAGRSGAPARAVYVTEIDGRGQVRWSLTPG